MSVDADATGGPGPVLEFRRRPPELPMGHVARTALLEHVSGSTPAKVVSVTAPAGFGKTTLLAEWVGVEERPVAWLSLDRTDRDPVALVASIASGFGRTQGFESAFWESMSSPGGSALGRLAPRLADAVAAASRPFILVLDDQHELSGSESVEVIDLLARRVPAGSTLAVAGRSEPAGLPSWRVGTSVVELGPEHLAFDLEGAQRFLESRGAVVSDDVLESLHMSLEGWAAGLQLAAVVSGRDSFSGFGGRDRVVADYLRREVLDGLSPEDRTFLTRSAVLDDLTGAACDAVLETENSTDRLQQLERANLFLVPLDRARSHYRYHAAFRELLLAELERSEGVASAPLLHRRASEWYDRRGESEAAMVHALRSGDTAWTVRLLAKVAQDFHVLGRVDTIQRWFDEIGEDAVLEYPPLAVLGGWAAAYSGDAFAARRWLDLIEGVSFEEETPVDGSASFVSARAMFRAFSCPDGPEQMLADAELAVASEPEWSVWRPTADALAAEAHLLLGDDEQAALYQFGDAIESSRASEIADCLVWCLAQRALMAMDRDDWSAARIDLAEASAVTEQCHMEDYLTSLLGHAAGARLAFHDGDREHAAVLLARGMRSRGTATVAAPTWAVQLRLVLAWVHLSIGEPVGARHLLREIDDVLRHRPHLGRLLADVDKIRKLVADAPKEGGASPLSPAELRVLPYFQTHLSFEEIANRLFLSRNTVASHARAIYRKLGVASRGDAVAAARSVGLLGDGVSDIS